MLVLLFIILLIIIIISITIIIFYIIENRSNLPHYKDDCKNDSDCKPNQICQYDGDYNKYICVDSKSKFCGITNNIDLYTCNPNQIPPPPSPSPSPSPPSSFFDCNNCTNQPEWGCSKVNWGNNWDSITHQQIINMGSKYSTGIAYASTQNTFGTGMIFNIKSIDNNNNSITCIDITNPGTNYNIGDIITIIQENSDNNATIKINSNFKPYVWKQNNKTIIIPETNFGWCLPKIINEPNCNIYTSDTVLESDGNGYYSWGCICHNPAMFDHISNGQSSCDSNKTCNNSGTLYVPYIDPNNNLKSCTTNNQCGDTNLFCCKQDWPLNKTGECLNDGETTTENNYYCHVPWNSQKNTDPRTGICICDQNKKFVSYVNTASDYSKLCLFDSCSSQYGGKFNYDTGICDCPPPYLSCGPNDGSTNPQVNICKEQICITDVCWPFGYYDSNSSSCKCIASIDEANTKNKDISNKENYYIYNENCQVEPNTNWANSSCKILCDSTSPYYPCINGSTCKVKLTDEKDPNSYKIEICTDCPCPNCNVGYCDKEIGIIKNEQDCTNKQGTWTPAEDNCEDLNNIALPYCSGINSTKSSYGEHCNSNNDCCSGLCNTFQSCF